MDVRRKLAILADAAKYDASCASSGSYREAAKGGLGNTEGMGICHSYTPDGRCVSLLKILFTNFCTYDCQYCINRISSDVERARFTPDEVVYLTLEFYKRNYIEGLFLSSGVLKSPDYTMEQLIAVARTLREEHKFHGYIHLKSAPGVSAELLDMAGRYADRLSVNVELPTEGDLEKLAPEKSLPAIEAAMGEIHSRVVASKEDRSSRKSAFAPAGQSTQMIVGATGTTDDAILATSTRLYQAHGLRRVYYSAYSPIPHGDARLPPEAPPLTREHRLYEADWLIRHYGFRADELTSAGAPNLDLELDPKLAWALRHREYFPVDVNRASREELLRVPGFGVRTVWKILAMRRHREVRMDDLSRLRLPMKRAVPFILTADDHRGATTQLDTEALARSFRAPRDEARQLGLFDVARGAERPLARPHVNGLGHPAPSVPLDLSAVTGEL